MIIFLLMHLIIFIYLFARLIVPLNVSKKIKFVLTLLIFAASQHYLLRFAFDSLSTPELPRLFIMFEGWCFATVVFLFLLVLGRDLFLLFRFVFTSGRRKRESRRYFAKKHSADRRKVMLALTAVAAAPAAFGVSQGSRVPAVRQWDEKLPGLPKELDGLVLAHITDLHVSPLFGPDWLEALVQKVNAMQPDLILFTGDMADGQPELRGMDVSALASLRAPYGVYGCVGNHEYYGGYRFWMNRLQELGMTMLENSHKVIEINGRELALAGVTDPVALEFGLPVPDVKAALADAPEGAFKILLEHRPSSFEHNAEFGVNLQLSGHTHGGHIIGMNQLVARFNGGHVYGWYSAGPSRMYVSSGAGLWNGFPVRIGASSEIARITLRAWE
ncbi:metallophosphoesterase [Desulfovibrio sp. OttesenSCG-928-C06]|nr:metallophosphoesterase [Desulfovibrio sp. OttesenSCG-928-C06]